MVIATCPGGQLSLVPHCDNVVAWSDPKGRLVTMVPARKLAIVVDDDPAVLKGRACLKGAPN